MPDDGPIVDEVSAPAYVIPTDAPEFLRGAALAAAHNLQVSAHCAPSLHAHVGVAVPGLRHVEYFHDHQRIERMFFDGALGPHGGILAPAPEPGLGMSFKEADAERYRQG